MNGEVAGTSEATEAGRPYADLSPRLKSGT
jgi:hypothetical protein